MPFILDPHSHSFESKIPADQRVATPDLDQEFQTFSTQQLEACARRAGFTVLLCEYADGRLSNYPSFLQRGWSL
jgi:hypothetical protein